MKNLSERSEGFLEAQDIFLEAGDGRSCKARRETMTEERNKPAKTNGSPYRLPPVGSDSYSTLNLRRANAAIPRIPEPTRASEAGSGIGSGVASVDAENEVMLPTGSPGTY